MRPARWWRAASVYVGLAAALAMPATAGEPSCAPVWRLYRTSTVLPRAFHVATFDSCERSSSATYPMNQSNCEFARDLFQNQPGVVVVYWCERDDGKDSK